MKKNDDVEGDEGNIFLYVKPQEVEFSQKNSCRKKKVFV